MRFIWRRLVTLMLIITLLPGWVELLENLEHLVHDGHLAHLVEHDADEAHAVHDALAAEHGCTPVSHSCSCHVSMPAILPPDPDMSVARTVVARARPPTTETTLVSRSTAPPVPPPTT